MNNITVVVKAGVFKDETAEIAIPERSDVKTWISESLTPVREQLRSLENKISEAGKKQSELERAIDSVKKALEQQSQTANSKLSSLEGRIAAVEQDKAQWESRFEAFAGKLGGEFITQCRKDVEEYFARLAGETKALNEESRKIVENQQKVSDQLALAALIAEFFCERYKLQLLNSEKELSHIAQLAGVLENWKTQNKTIEK